MHVDANFLDSAEVTNVRRACFQLIRFLGTPADASGLTKISLILASPLPFFSQALACSDRYEHFFDQYQLT